MGQQPIVLVTHWWNVHMVAGVSICYEMSRYVKGSRCGSDERADTRLIYDETVVTTLMLGQHPSQIGQVELKRTRPEAVDLRISSNLRPRGERSPGSQALFLIGMHLPPTIYKTTSSFFFSSSTAAILPCYRTWLTHPQCAPAPAFVSGRHAARSALAPPCVISRLLYRFCVK